MEYRYSEKYGKVITNCKDLMYEKYGIVIAHYGDDDYKLIVYNIMDPLNGANQDITEQDFSDMREITIDFDIKRFKFGLLTNRRFELLSVTNLSDIPEPTPTSEWTEYYMYHGDDNCIDVKLDHQYNRVIFDDYLVEIIQTTNEAILLHLIDRCNPLISEVIKIPHKQMYDRCHEIMIGGKRLRFSFYESRKEPGDYTDSVTQISYREV